MAKRKLTSEDLQAIYQLARNWGKTVSQRAFGDDGPDLGVDITDMEEVAVAAMRGLAAGTMETATAKQALRLDANPPCPECGRSTPAQNEMRPVTARGGPFEHNEPKCYCPACRRDFFPSASLSETGQPRL
jgi:hypothetical protein